MSLRFIINPHPPRMTAVTGRTLIDVSALPFVFTIHRRLCVFVTIDAFEERIIRSGGVTIRTVIPSTGTMFVPRTDREILFMREERGRFPSESTMTRGTVQRETGRGMIRTCCCGIILHMTCRTIFRCLPEQSVRMATDAFHRFMDAPCGELRLIMIETRAPRHSIRGMTEETIGDESCCAVIRRCGAVEIVLMT
jgi:hypothetical protein